MSLSSKQRQVVECADKDCLVVACPGSGKTHVLTYKCDHIFKIDPGARIMLVTFTSDAAAAIRKRVIAKVGSQHAGNIASGTFHSLALSQITDQLKIRPNIISDGQIKQYIERAYAECQPTDINLDEAYAYIDEDKSNPNYEPGNDSRGRLYQAYTRLLERNGVIDFADMLAITVRGMREGSIQPKPCTYLMIDEAQDLDEMQYAWAAEHIRDRENRKGSIFTVVGDDDQSIYKFRRALGYAGMMRFKDEFNAEVITLDTNFRCRSEILDSAGKVIANNTIRVNKDLKAHRGKGGRAHTSLYGSPASESNAVVSKIKEVCVRNPIRNPIQIKVKKENGQAELVDYVYSIGVAKEEWAVLARNSFTLRVIAADLKAQGIPYTFNGPDMWEDRPVCLAVSLLQSLITRQKVGFDIALHYAGIDEQTLDKLHEKYGEDFTSLADGSDRNLDQYGKGTAATLHAFFQKLSGWDRGLSKARDKRINLVITGVFDWFISNLNTPLSDKDSQNEKNKLSLLKRKLEEASAIMCKMDGMLIDRIKKVTSKPEPPKPIEAFDKDDPKKVIFVHGAVYLGTLHSSKGLEFENVWMVSMNDGVIPSIKDDVWTPELHEEERRLFYVGMTRAKNYLEISACDNPSSYLAETDLEFSADQYEKETGKTASDLLLTPRQSAT